MATILIIDDDANMLEQVLEFLALENFEGISAKNGQEGLAIAIEQHPDLILCDVMMPVMDGFEVLKQVREHPEISKIPFIFLSAAINEENVQKGLDLGANAFLAKPFHFQQIMSHIRAYLP